MQEAWFCENCRSMNRAQSSVCYRCHAPKAQATLATVQEQRPADVAIPGIDHLDGGQAAALLGHAYQDVSALGYLAAASLGIAALASAVTLLLTALVVLVASTAGSFRLNAAGAGVLLVAGGVSSLAVPAGILLHSVFLGLTTRNVPALGGGQPSFGALRAGLWWLEAGFWVLAASFVVWSLPGIAILLMAASMILGFQVFGLIGLVAVVIAIEWTRRELDLSLNVFRYSLAALRRPARPLDELASRLGAKGSPGHDLVGLWSASWVSGFAITIFMPLLGLGIAVAAVGGVLIARLAGIDVRMPSAAELDWAQRVFEALMALVATLASLLAIFFMARLTLWLTRAQRDRRRWVVAAAGGPGGRPAPSPASTPGIGRRPVTPAVTPGPAQLVRAGLPQSARPSPVAPAAPRPALGASPAPTTPPTPRAVPPAAGIARLAGPAAPTGRVIGYVPDPVSPPAPGPDSAGAGAPGGPPSGEPSV
jgi:hypothetical protein